jgi:hypothetical protein
MELFDTSLKETKQLPLASDLRRPCVQREQNQGGGAGGSKQKVWQARSPQPEH